MKTSRNIICAVACVIATALSDLAWGVDPKPEGLDAESIAHTGDALLQRWGTVLSLSAIPAPQLPVLMPDRDSAKPQPRFPLQAMAVIDRFNDLLDVWPLKGIAVGPYRVDIKLSARRMLITVHF